MPSAPPCYLDGVRELPHRARPPRPSGCASRDTGPIRARRGCRRPCTRRRSRRSASSTRSRSPSPAIDCFYVYPTVSGQTTGNSNLQIDPEEKSIALYQASRYSQYCHVYAPMYRQTTLAGIGAPGTHAAEAAAEPEDRAAGRPRGVRDVSEEVQPRPRDRVHRPLAGLVRPAPAARQGRRPEACGPQAAGVGDPDGRQRAGQAGHRTSAATSSTSPRAVRRSRSGA